MCKKVTEFDTLDAVERAATKAALDRCRALVGQIEGELCKSKPGHFHDLTLLADFQVSLEVAAEVLDSKAEAVRQRSKAARWPAERPSKSLPHKAQARQCSSETPARNS
jgi:hypothetical protein